MIDIPKHDVVVIGSLNADLAVKSLRFPQPGETISGGDLQIIPGGKGANQAVAAARQGVKTAMVGRVGSDGFGPFLVENLNANQVDTTHVLVDESATGTAIIVVDAKGQNSIVLSPGANGKVSSNDVDSAPDAKVLLLQFEIPMEVVLHAAKRYKGKGTTVILNPAPAREIPAELLANVDILILNESELSLLTGMTVSDAATAEKAAKEVLQQGMKTVIVTLGSKGALLAANTQVSGTQVDTYQVGVVDTTAAGDAFIGGFASKIIERNRRAKRPTPTDAQESASYARDLEDSVRYGCACGALATTKFGAQPSLPTKDEVNAFILHP
ncbi:MAG: ribokinase [Chloroflexi bacterium]|jgi:ribokinase|nr:ribokinase [Chloroflexota bacterium]